MKRILSLGAGVQSTTVLLMSCKGLLPKLDCAIFADTQWEPKAVYEHLEWLKGEAERHGIPVQVVTAGNLRAETLASFKAGTRVASIPAFVVNPDGSRGLVPRQCTKEYKIEPIERFIRTELLGLRRGQPGPRHPVIEQWMGISADEATRMRDSGRRWMVNRYPLIHDLTTARKPGQLFEHGYTRQDCVGWLQANYPDRLVPRSACIGCPFHDDNEWLIVKSHPEEWANVLAFDRALRGERHPDKTMKGELYLHRSFTPLEMVDLQPGRFAGDGMANECMGMCGV